MHVCLLCSLFVTMSHLTAESDLVLPSGGSLHLGKMFHSSRDSLISPDTLYFSQVPVPGHGQEIFRRKVAPPKPALTVQLQLVEAKDLQGSSEPPLPLDCGKSMALEVWDRDSPFSDCPSSCRGPLSPKEKLRTFFPLWC